MTGFVRLHALLVNDNLVAQVCRDLSESACREPLHNHGEYLVSLTLTRFCEGLADPKLVLAWLLDAIGAPPPWALGLLAPMRESFALLPQTVISARIRRLLCKFVNGDIFDMVLRQLLQSPWHLSGRNREGVV